MCDLKCPQERITDGQNKGFVPKKNNLTDWARFFVVAMHINLENIQNYFFGNP